MKEQILPDADQLLDEKKVCELIGNITPRTLRLWRLTRGLPHMKISSKVIRYRRSDVREWVGRSRTVVA
jgi:hypothetical protein